MKNLEKYALGFLLGNSIYTFILFLANLKGISFTEYNLTIILIFICSVTALIGYVIKNLRKVDLNDIYTIPDNHNHKYLIYGKLYLALVFIIVLLSSLYSPVKDCDSLVLYDFRAKTLSKLVYVDNIVKDISLVIHYKSLSHTWAYLFGLAINHSACTISSHSSWLWMLMRRINLSRTSILITQILIASLPRFSVTHL
jgi:hypothetical protein